MYYAPLHELLVFLHVMYNTYCSNGARIHVISLPHPCTSICMYPLCSHQVTLLVSMGDVFVGSVPVCLWLKGMHVKEVQCACALKYTMQICSRQNVECTMRGVIMHAGYIVLCKVQYLYSCVSVYTAWLNFILYFVYYYKCSSVMNALIVIKSLMLVARQVEL